MQDELRAQFPTQQFDILGVNEAGQEADYDLATNDRTLPLLQDVNNDGNPGSDVWTSWAIAWRDVVVVDADNNFVGVYNLTTQDLGNAANYAMLKQMFVDALTQNETPDAPTSIDLLPESDSGADSADNVTNFNNADAARALRLRVGGVLDGATVRVFAGGTLIGSGLANGGFADVVTNGLQSIGDGPASITATQEVGGVTSDPSAATSITIDTAAAAITSTAVTAGLVAQVYSYDVQTAEEGAGNITYVLVAQPNGMTIDAATGVVSWTPTAAQFGNASVTVRSVDRAGNVADQSFTVAVTSPNDPPIALDDAYSTDEDTLLSIAAPGVLDNDSDTDASDVLGVIAFDATSTRGAAVSVLGNGSFTYDPRVSAELGALGEGQSLEDTFTYTLGDGHGGQDIATVRVAVAGRADAPPPTMSVADATVTEGSGQTNLVFTVSLSSAATNAVTVQFATSNQAATAGADYTATSGTLTFAAGETSKTVTVPLLADNIDEADETLVLTLSSPTGATFATAEDATATGTITDDDPTPTITVANVTVTEGDSGTVNATLTATLSNPSSQTITVAFQTQDGTATSSNDYSTRNGTITFAPNETSKTIEISITTDAVTESTETFRVALSNPENATLAQIEATVTIDDDDAPGAIEFSTAEVTVDESAGTATITVVRQGGDAAGVTVRYATSNGTATAGGDYTAQSGTLSFAAGETQKTFSVPILVDAVMEEPETLTLTLSDPTGGATLAPRATSTLRITEVQETPEEVLVTHAYDDLLGRAPEDAGLAFYMDRLEDGTMNAFQMATAIQNSTEFRTGKLEMFYQDFLGRNSDARGIAAHMAFLAAGGSWDELRVTFLKSDEYYRRAGGSQNGFLAALYQDVMGRAIDPVGLREFGGLMRGDKDRADVARRLLQTAEARNHKVAAAYDELLERSASGGEIDFYARQLQNGTREPQIIAAFMASPEYAERD